MVAPTEEKETVKVRFEDLPLVDELGKKARARAEQIFHELEEHTFVLVDGQRVLDAQGKPVTREKRIAELERELQEIQENFEKPGLRCGDLAFSAQQRQGRETLSKELLIENGVKASVIAKSIKTGEPYWTRTLRRVEKRAEGR